MGAYGPLGPLGAPPRDLDQVARAEWRRVAPLLESSGVAGQVDRSAMIAMCQSWSRYVRANTDVERNGLTTTNGFGAEVLRPQVKERDKALAQWERLAGQFGLLPVERLRLVPVERVKLDPREARKRALLEKLSG